MAPLDYSEILVCLNEHEIEGLERREFVYVIQELDFVWRSETVKLREGA